MSEIGVRLTGDNSEYRSMLSDSVDRGIEFGGKLADKVGEKLYGLRDVSHTVATALGLNLAAVSENLARVWADLSKEEEAAFHEADRLSDENAALQLKNIRAVADEETRYHLLLEDRARAQKEISDIEAAAAARSIDTARLVYETGKGFRIDTDRDIQLSGQERLKVEQANRVLIETNAELARADAAKRLEEAKAETDSQIASAKRWEDFQKSLESAAEQRRKDQKAGDEAALKLEEQVWYQHTQEVAANEKLAAAVRERAAAEAEVAAALEKQASIQKELNDLNAQANTPITGGLDVLQVLGGQRSYNNPADQRAYEAQLEASVKADIDNKIKAYTDQINSLQRSGSSYGAHDIPIYQANITALQGRAANVHDYIFNAQYMDSIGPGLSREQAAYLKQSNDVATKTQQTLVAISQQLAGSGIFPTRGTLASGDAPLGST